MTPQSVSNRLLDYRARSFTAYAGSLRRCHPHTIRRFRHPLPTLFPEIIPPSPHRPMARTSFQRQPGG